jgi:hypothetical protein
MDMLNHDGIRGLSVHVDQQHHLDLASPTADKPPCVKKLNSSRLERDDTTAGNQTVAATVLDRTTAYR